jgi:hypothetical protein
MLGYFNGAAYRVSDTCRIHIHVGYASDTYPRRVLRNRYVSAPTRVLDTAGLHWTRQVDSGPRQMDKLVCIYMYI